MAQKNISGDLNVTGAIKLSGTTLSPGTKLYKHSFYVYFGGPAYAVIFISTSSEQITGKQLYDPSGSTTFILDDPHTISCQLPESTRLAYGKSIGGGQAFSVVDIKDISNDYTLSSEPTITDTVTQL